MTTMLQAELGRKAFLAVLAKKGTVTAAAEYAGISRVTVYKWKDEDPEFAAAFARAEREYVETLEAEAHRRAVEGDDVPVFQRGQHVGNIRKRSDVLLMFLLNGAAPEKYRRDRAGDVNVAIQNNLHVDNLIAAIVQAKAQGILAPGPAGANAADTSLIGRDSTAGEG